MTEGGAHHDDGKPRVELIDPHLLEGVGRVLAWGAGKYAERNWEKGIRASRLYGSALRHLLAWARREDLDPESGLPHLHHLVACVMMLAWTVRERPDLDDRAGRPAPESRRLVPDFATRHGDVEPEYRRLVDSVGNLDAAARGR